MDTTQQTEQIRHDLEALEHTAERSMERFARRIAPYVIGTFVVAALAWRAGRRARNKKSR